MKEDRLIRALFAGLAMQVEYHRALKYKNELGEPNLNKIADAAFEMADKMSDAWGRRVHDERKNVQAAQ